MTEQTVISTEEVVNFALQFLSRVQLTGQEVPAFNVVVNWLETSKSCCELPTSDENIENLDKVEVN